MQELFVFIANHMALTYALAITLVLLMAVEFFRAKRDHSHVTIPKAIQLINRESAAVIDIRTQDAYRQGHIIDSQFHSPKELEGSTKKLEKFRTKPILLVSNTGAEAQKIAALLMKQGYNTYLLSGGMRAWLDAGMPLVKE